MILKRLGELGRSRYWLGQEAVNGNSFRFSFPDSASEVRFSFAMPYQESHWSRFIADVGDHLAVKQDRLCVTAKGREVECLTLHCRSKLPQHRVVITCRHHCCEMMANYVLEGLIRWILVDRRAEWLRDNVEFLLVPFVDKDGVQEGDQGKSRRPRDHGLDYEGESIFAATKNIRTRLPEWGGGRLRVGLDLHCPHISGAHNEAIYLVGSADDLVAAEQERFSHLLEAVTEGPLPFSSANFLPFGASWNTDANYEGGKGFDQWVAELPGVLLGTAIEIPYATASGAEVNRESARLFGIDLAKGILEYLKSIN